MMQTKHILQVLATASILLFVSQMRAQLISAQNSGNWSDPNTWSGGVVPGATNFVDVESPYNVVVNTNTEVQYIIGSGSVTMGTNVTLQILDFSGGIGTAQLTNFDCTAPSNTVVYTSNPFWAKHTDYYNLIFTNTVETNQINFYTGYNGVDPAVPMTVAGNMSIYGKIRVQLGADFTIIGNLYMSTNSGWDCSSFNMTVQGLTTLHGGYIQDLDGAGGADTFNNIAIDPTSVTNGTWDLNDSTNYFVLGNLTNNVEGGGVIGTAYASINFNGMGVITGKPIILPTLTFNGTNTIDTTITLTTNTPSLNGTLVFDIAKTNQMILMSYPPVNLLPLYYGGVLIVTNTGPSPMSGNTYQLFSASSFGGGFNTTSFPPLVSGLSWSDNLFADGSISVTGTAVLPPAITEHQYDSVTRQFTLTWTSTPGAMYTIQESPTLDAPSWTTLQSNIPSGGSTTTYIVTMPAGTAGFLQVYQQ